MDEEFGVRVTRSRRRMSMDQDFNTIETTPAPATPMTAKANRRMSMDRQVKIPEDNASATPTKRKPGRMSIKPEPPTLIENITRSRRRMSMDQDFNTIETTPAPATPTTAKANHRMSMDREVKIPEDSALATPTKRKPGRMSIKPEPPAVIKNWTPSKKSPELPSRGRMSILPTEGILEDVVQSERMSKRTQSKKATGTTEDEASDAGVQTETPTKRVTRNLAATVNSPRTRRISRRMSVAGKDNFSSLVQLVRTLAKDDSTINENTPNSNVTLVMRNDSILPIRKSPRLNNSPKKMCGARPSNTICPEKTHKLIEASPTKAQRKSLSASLEGELKIGKCESPIDVFAPKGDISELEPPQPMDVDNSFQFNDTFSGSSGLVLDSVSDPEKSHQSQRKEISINIKNDNNTSFKVSFTSSATSIDILGTGNAAKKSDADIESPTGDSISTKNKRKSLNNANTPIKNAQDYGPSNAEISKMKRNSESGHKTRTSVKNASDADIETPTGDYVSTKNKRKSLNKAMTPIKNAQDNGQSDPDSFKMKKNSESGHVTPVKNAQETWSANNRNSSLDESIAKAKTATGNTAKKTKKSDIASELDFDPRNSTRKTPNKSSDDTAEFPMLILSETGNISSERLISSTNSNNLNSSKSLNKSIMLNANSDDDFIKISNKSNSQISSTEEGGFVKKCMTSAKLFSSEKLCSKTLPISTLKNNIAKQHVSFGDNPKHSLKLFKNIIATSTPNVNKAGNDVSEPTSIYETVCLDSESEKLESDDDDDYESSDSIGELIEHNKISDLSETLDFASSISSDNSASDDLFFVSSDEKDEELLSGTGDDLSSGDDEMTFSANSKEKFNKAVKTQNNPLHEMYRSRLAADESDDEVVTKPKLSKSKNILSDAEENDAASGNSQNITVIDNTKKHKEEDKLSSLSEGDDVKAITSNYNKILKDLKTERISKLDNDSKNTALKNNSLMGDFGPSPLYRNESVNASQSKNNEIKRSSKRNANYSINSDFGMSALHATEIEKLDTSETKKNEKANPWKQAGNDLNLLKNTMLKDTHKAIKTSKESISKKRIRNEADRKHESVFIAPLLELFFSHLMDSSKRSKKKKTKVAPGFTVEDLQDGECELDMTIIDEEPPTFAGSSGDFKVVKKAKVKVPLGVCWPSKLGSTTEFQVTSSSSTTKFKVVAVDKHRRR